MSAKAFNALNFVPYDTSLFARESILTYLIPSPTLDTIICSEQCSPLRRGGGRYTGERFEVEWLTQQVSPRRFSSRSRKLASQIQVMHARDLGGSGKMSVSMGGRSPGAGRPTKMRVEFRAPL